MKFIDFGITNGQFNNEVDKLLPTHLEIFDLANSSSFLYEILLHFLQEILIMSNCLQNQNQTDCHKNLTARMARYILFPNTQEFLRNYK